MNVSTLETLLPVLTVYCFAFLFCIGTFCFIDQARTVSSLTRKHCRLVVLLLPSSTHPKENEAVWCSVFPAPPAFRRNNSQIPDFKGNSIKDFNSVEISWIHRNMWKIVLKLPNGFWLRNKSTPPPFKISLFERRSRNLAFLFYNPLLIYKSVFLLFF